MTNETIELTIPGNTPLNKYSDLFGVRTLLVKDETGNPTHTFKDRLAYEAVRPIVEAINLKQSLVRITLGSISYGNTAYSIGHYAAMLNRKAGELVVNVASFIPPSLKKKTFGPNTEGQIVPSEAFLQKMFSSCSDAHAIEIDLSKQIYRSEDLERIVRAEGVVLDRFIDVTEGLDRPAYVNIIIEAVEQQLKFAPDYVMVPFGAGILCDEIIDYVADNQLPTKVVPVSSGNPDTIAIMLYGPIWVDTKTLLEKGSAMTRRMIPDRKGRSREQYLVHHVSDEEIVDAMGILRREGISAEASGASGFAILPRLKEIDPEFDPQKHSVLVINTGNGLLNFTQ
jgi:threonine dehydratase